jgi:hypothetical protein
LISIGIENKIMKNTNKQIYIVTRGEYSDYSIMGVFDDISIANEYAAQIVGTVESHDINDNSHLELPIGHRVYSIWMDEDGNTDNISQADSGCSSFPTTEYKTRKKDTYPFPSGKEAYYEYDGGYQFYITTNKGEIGAIKIANEQRAHLIATNQWPTKGKQELIR